MNLAMLDDKVFDLVDFLSRQQMPGLTKTKQFALLKQKKESEPERMRGILNWVIVAIVWACFIGIPYLPERNLLTFILPSSWTYE